jgi:ubiquinone/menaquinone biosynthesis C-methylase UbiE
MPHVFDGDPLNLENPARQQILPAMAIIKQADVQSGNIVVDYGSGSGYFTGPLLQVVGDKGMVIAIDQSSKMTQFLKERMGDQPNLTIIQADSLTEIKNPVDFIFIITVLHELPDYRIFLKMAISKIKSSGSIILVDWAKTETSMGPAIHERISKQEIIDFLPKQKIIEHPIDQYFYFLQIFP